MDFTTRLALRKPNSDPVTGDVLNVDDLNQNFDTIDSVISFTPCTSSTRPTVPFQGQGIVETDTNRAYIRIGSAWIQLAGQTGRMLTNIEFERPTSGDWVLSGHVTGDTQKRFILDAKGLMQWGPGGSTAPDVNLYRQGVNELRTDDNFTVNGKAVTGNKDGLNGVLLSTATAAPTSYANLPAKAAGGSASFSFTKKRSDTRLRVSMGLLAYADATSTGMQLGVLINGTDYDVSKCYYTSAIYLPANGWTYISGISAGTYTVQGRWKRFSGSGNLGTFDGISELDLEVEEIA